MVVVVGAGGEIHLFFLLLLLLLLLLLPWGGGYCTIVIHVLAAINVLSCHACTAHVSPTQEKLRLDIDDEAAFQWMQQLINESATALMPQIMETTHRWAQYWR